MSILNNLVLYSNGKIDPHGHGMKFANGDCYEGGTTYMSSLYNLTILLIYK